MHRCMVIRNNAARNGVGRPTPITPISFRLNLGFDAVGHAFHLGSNAWIAVWVCFNKDGGRINGFTMTIVMLGMCGGNQITRLGHSRLMLYRSVGGSMRFYCETHLRWIGLNRSRQTKNRDTAVPATFLYSRNIQNLNRCGI